MAQDGAMPQETSEERSVRILAGIRADLKVTADRVIPFLDAQPAIKKWLKNHRFKSFADVPRERQGELYDAVRAACVDKAR